MPESNLIVLIRFVIHIGDRFTGQGRVNRIKQLIKLGRLLGREEDCPPQDSLRQFALECIAPALLKIKDVYELSLVWPKTLLELRKAWVRFESDKPQGVVLPSLKVRCAPF